MSDIACWLCDPVGTPVMPLAHFDRLEYTRGINAVGELAIILPGHFDVSLARVDGLIQVWRDGRLDTDTAWLIRKTRRATDAQRVGKVVLTAYSGADLLRRRVVSATSASGDADKSGAADDLMKAYVRENLGRIAPVGKQLPSSLFTVAANNNLGATVTHAGGYQNLLETCQDLAKASTDNGTPLFFDVVYIPDRKLWEFRTYTGSRGTDKGSTSGAPQTLGVERGSVGEETLTDDYAEEITYVYVGAGGSGDEHIAHEDEDVARSNRSVYGRREAFLSSTADDVLGIVSEARAALQRGRPRRTFVASMISTPSMTYGRDWNFGDVLAAEAFGTTFDCRVDAVHVVIDNLDGGREHTRARLMNEADL